MTRPPLPVEACEPLDAGDLLLVAGYLDAMARNPGATQMVSADMARRLMATVRRRDRDFIDSITNTLPGTDPRG